jgi:predicted nucleic acid-binding protein
MRVFLDTNVLLATILDDADLADESTRLLNRDDLEFVTSSINVMELRAG